MISNTNKSARFTLPMRIRNKRKTASEFSTRMAFIDRIADLPGIETAERDDETLPRRVDIYVKREGPSRVLKRRPPQILCSLDCSGVFLNGLDFWERYQVVARRWGKLVGDQVCVHLPRDSKELEIVWKIFQRGYERLVGPVNTESESPVITTWDFPRFSRTSLQ